MKIAVISSWYPSKEDKVNGVFVQENVNAVNKGNTEVSVFHLQTINKGFYPKIDFVKEIFEGVQVYRVYMKWPIGMKQALKEMKKNIFPSRDKQTSLKFEKKVKNYEPSSESNRILACLRDYVRKIVSWGLIYLLRRLLKNFELIHAYVAYPAGFVASVVSKKLSIPLVYTEVASDLGVVYGLCSKARKNYIFKGVSSLADRADCFVLVSGDEKKQYAALNISIRNPIVIHTIYDSNYFYCGTGSKCEKIVGVFCGILGKSEQKGMQHLIPAVASLPKIIRSKIRVDVIGYGEMMEVYQEKVQELDVEENFRFLGKKTLTEIAECMRESDFFLIPSLHEGMPCVLMEAMACGLPVVGSNVGGIPEIVSKEVGILVEPANVEKLTWAISEIAKNYKNYDKKFISSTVKSYSYDGYQTKMSLIYSSLRHCQQ